MLSVPVNVILPAYGELFAIGIVLLTRSDRALVVLALVLAVTMPFVVGVISGGAALWLLSWLGDEPHASGMGEAIGSGGFALAVIGVCTLIGRTQLRWPVWPVRVLGSMPLTAYTSHLVIWAGWIAITRSEGGSVDTLDGFRALDPFWPMTFGVMVGCIIWAVFVGRGPLEAAVSRLSAVDRTAAASPGDERT